MQIDFKKYLKSGWILIIVGALITQIKGAESLGSVIFIVGIGILMYERKKKQKAQPFHFSIFLAHSNKHEGFHKLVSNEWRSSTPYYGISDDYILDSEYGRRFFKNKAIYFKGISIIPEPKNPYNPKALAVIADGYGKIGYIPDSNLEQISKILKRNPELQLVVKGGDYKVAEYGSVKEYSKEVTGYIEFSSKDKP